MAEVLSQSEIDALLAAMSSGEVQKEVDSTEKKVKVYDFKRALRVSKDQIRNLTRIHETYARMLTTFFSAQMRTFVQINVASVDQLPYEEFIRSIPESTVLATFDSSSLQGRMLLEVSPHITQAILERLFGGSGSVRTNDAKGGLTEIEIAVLERLYLRILSLFHDAWKDLIEIDPGNLELETNSQFVQIVSPNETVVVISFSIRIGETTGVMNLCLPYIVLEPVMPKLTTSLLFSQPSKEQTGKKAEKIKESVHRIKLPLVVELGNASISIEEFLNLEAGDVIQLNQSIDDRLAVKIGPTVKFHGRPGTKKGHMAIRIEKVLAEGVEENE